MNTTISTPTNWHKIIADHFMTCKTSTDGIILDASDEFCNILMHSKSEIVGQPHSLFASGFHNNAFWHSFWQELHTNHKWQGEICNKTKNNTLIWFNVHISAHTDTSGNILEFNSLFSNISKRKIFDEPGIMASIYQKQAKNDAALALITTDNIGKIKIMNHTAELLLASKKSELIGMKHFVDFIDTDELSRRSLMLSTEVGLQFSNPLEILTAHARLNLRNDTDWTLIRPNGTKLICTINITPLNDVNDEMEGWMLLFRDITIQRSLEDNLRRSQLLWQTAVENSHIGVWDWDIDNNTVYFSNHWKKMLGYSPDEISNALDEWQMRVHPEDLNPTLHKINEHIVGNTDIYISEHRMLHKNGTWIWIHDCGKISERLSNGKPKRFIGTHTDITKQKTNQIIASKNALQSRAILENTSAIIWAIDNQMHLIDFNSHFSKFCSELYDIAPLINKPVLDCFGSSEFHKEYWQRLYDRTIDGEELEIEIKHKRQSFDLWMRYSFRTIKDENNELQGICVYGIDISEDKYREQQIIESESKLRAIIENTSSMIWSIDRNYNLTAFNHNFSFGFENISGVKPHLGLSVIPTPKDQSISYDYFLKHYDDVFTGKSLDLEEHQNLNNKSSSYSTSLNPIYSKSGKVIGATGICTDITEQINNQNQLKNAKELAESALKAKSQFLSIMSHEIRTPMNAVIGMTNLLLQENPTVEQREYLEILQFSTENLLVLINDILDFSKIEAGKINLEFIPVNIPILFRNIANTLSLKAQENINQIKIEYPENIPQTFLADPVRLGQILTNLTSNAAKFTHHGTITIGAKVIQDSSSNKNINLFVRDTGIGIPPEKHANIFEAFTQASDDTTRKYGGTGLGLAITQKLIEIHGSKIQLESQVGKGSTFSFDLYLEPSDEQISNTSQSQTQNLEVFDLHQASILLVEDNLVNVKVACKFLERWNTQVTVAHNGIEALEHTQSKKFDLILMDLHMPILDGYEASKEIRLTDKSTPILGLSAEAIHEVQQKATEVGMNDFIGKPFNPKDLYKKIENWISISKK